MISKVSSVENNKYTPNRDAKKTQQPAFSGIADTLLRGIQLCEENPMVNVSVLDLSTAIVPRTIIETKQSNGFAGTEAFLRESSGLIVNCLIPSFIVMGLAKLLQKPFVKDFNKTNLSKIWANEESLNLIKGYLSKAEGTGTQKLTNALTSFFNDVEGIDGSKYKSFSEFDLSSGIKKLADASIAKKPKKLLEEGYKQIADTAHMTEHIRLKGSKEFLSKNLKGIAEDFVHIHRAVENAGIKNADHYNKFFKNAVKLVNWKSFAGLGVIIPLAISMQPLNRWITSKRSGVKGAPIYKDFAQNKEQREMTPREKAALLKQKFISVGSMIGVALLSMGLKLPNKQMLQFKGIFPTMDQARIISTATFASRMMASEDKNELREATIRDIATFSSLYFLGDYAAKGVATLIEKIKPDVKLLNRLKEAPKDANILKKLAHWLKDVSLKSSDEVVGKTAKNLRSVCQLGNLAFSLLALGIFIPLYTRTQTNKKREAELKKLAESINSTNGFLRTQIKNNSPAFKSFFSLQ